MRKAAIISGIVISIMLLLYGTYHLALNIAIARGIEKEIIPSLSGFVPAMRGDILMFCGLISMYIILSAFIFDLYDRKKSKNI